jgi:osmotically-inducible protein OsmY
MEINMSKSQITCRIVTLGLVIAGVLSGCAMERKCGLAGCGGDAKTSADIKSSFDQHPDLGPPNFIQVQTLDHVVYLSGEVSAGYMRASAQSIALETPGVARVVNTISVTH